jgi:hypothetical protein
MGIILQGYWSFATASLSSSAVSSYTFVTNSQSNTINSLKIITTVPTYINFYGQTATPSTSFLIPASMSFDFDPFLGDKISCFPSGSGITNSTIYFAYFQNKQVSYNQTF